ncbi:MAG: tRNA-binding protein [bacterium]|nr:MAG: tRNA-binding protein [bacterium]
MDTISFNDFEKIDIRIGTVVEASVPEWSHWVMKIKADFGEELGIKQAFSGIMKFYKPEDLTGKQFPFVVNLKPKTIGPEKELSEVMMVMAVPKEDEETPTVLFSLPEVVPNGTKVR